MPRLTTVLIVLLATAGTATAQDVCWSVSDETDSLVRFDPWSNGRDAEEIIGQLGAENVDAIAMQPETGTLYAADGRCIGTVDVQTGEFSRLACLGNVNGRAGRLPVLDIDSMAFHPRTGELYATVDCPGGDLLIQIDPETGMHVPGAFRGDNDYEVLDVFGPIEDVGAIAFHPRNNKLFAVVTGEGRGTVLAEYNTTNGRAIHTYNLGNVHLGGLSFDVRERMWASGFDPDDNGHWVWHIDPNDGSFLHSRRMHSGGQYNGVECAPNEIVDLRVRIRISTRIVREEARVTITITVRNRGNSDANNVLVRHRLARVFEWLESVAERGDYNLGEGVWRVRVVRAGELVRLVIRVRVRPFTDGHESSLDVEAEHEDGPGEFQPEDNEDEDEFEIQLDPNGDPDNDGLTNEDEETLGTNRADADSDGDGQNDGDEVGEDVDNARDTDGDGIRDVFDTDDDGDGIPTRDERGDVDGDDLPDHLDANHDDGPLGDLDDDNIPNGIEEQHGTNPDDNDSDDDGIRDDGELRPPHFIPRDTDGDGLIDALDPDDDNDGRPTRNDRGDRDGDRIPDHLDANEEDGPLGDLDNDNIPNGIEDEHGTDPEDSDSDDDGIRDDGELRPPNFVPRDTDGDGLIDALDPDDDNDGRPTRNDRGDRDGDRVPDHLDPNENDGPLGDLDDDNVPNGIEEEFETNPNDGDSDGDGLGDAEELVPQHNPRDSDDDGVIDALDPDDDNDGRPTQDDRGDEDGDGILDHLDPNHDDGPFGDLDGDTIDNGVEREWGTDPMDRDSDDDGIPDNEEPPGHVDTDGDGTPDIMDPDSDNDGVFDGTEVGLTPEMVGEDTDMDAGHFFPDMDPRTTTDPRNNDTDGDGRRDGAEDTDGNGRVDQGESDPNHRDNRGEVTPGDEDNGPQDGPVVEEPEVAPGDDDNGGEMVLAPGDSNPEEQTPAPVGDDDIDTYVPSEDDSEVPVDSNWENPDEAQTPGGGGFAGDVPGCGCSQPGSPTRLPLGGLLGGILLGGFFLLRRRS